MAKSLPERARDWDDYVEDHDREGAVQPFDAGLVLASATLIDKWDKFTPLAGQIHPDIVEAVKGIRDTLDAFVDEYTEDPDDE